MIASLIARLEAASGPSVELDEEIRVAVDAENINYWPAEFAPTVGTYEGPVAYTASIDAALTLVPEGLFFLFGIGRVRSGEPLAAAQIMRPVTLDQVAEAEADTLPIAICIAALKARAAQ